ncbi:MAG: peptidase M23, partial [Lentisphaerae bacterium]|nr:peptidase M23 [Lentisphaerota bacterium]
PVSGDYDGDGASDLAMYMERLGLWFIRSASGELLLWGGAFGGMGFTPVSGDFDGDGASDLAVYGNGLWYIRTIDGTILQWGVPWGGPGFQAASR